MSPSLGPMSAPDASVSAEVDTDDLTWVGVTDAARQTGISAGAIRSWIGRGEVRSCTGRGPRGARTEVAIEDVQDRAETVLTDGSRPTSTDLEPLADRFAQLGSLIHQSGQDMAEWRARATAAEIKLGFLTDQLAAARALPEQLHAEIAAAHGDSERVRVDLEQARAEAVELRAELVRAREQIVALQQQLRSARRPLFGRRPADV